MNFDYRDLLKSEFNRRRYVNRTYSLRAFARDAGLTAPHLSAILSGKRGLSKDRAAQIAKSLGLSDQESQQFISDVSARHGRSRTEKSIAASSLKKLAKDGSPTFGRVKEAQFRVISDWYHLALLQLSETEDFSWEPRFIANRLGLSTSEASRAIKSLVDSGLLKKSGEAYEKTDQFIRTDDVPSRAIRLNHLQLISKAMKALEEQSIDQRDFSSVTVAIDPKRIAEMKSWLKDFREKFCVEANQRGRKTEVYNLSLQFFKLSTSN